MSLLGYFSSLFVILFLVVSINAGVIWNNNEKNGKTDNSSSFEYEAGLIVEKLLQALSNTTAQTKQRSERSINDDYKPVELSYKMAKPSYSHKVYPKKPDYVPSAVPKVVYNKPEVKYGISYNPPSISYGAKSYASNDMTSSYDANSYVDKQVYADKPSYPEVKSNYKASSLYYDDTSSYNNEKAYETNSYNNVNDYKTVSSGYEDNSYDNKQTYVDKPTYTATKPTYKSTSNYEDTSYNNVKGYETKSYDVYKNHNIAKPVYSTDASSSYDSNAYNMDQSKHKSYLGYNNDKKVYNHKYDGQSIVLKQPVDLYGTSSTYETKIETYKPSSYNNIQTYQSHKVKDYSQQNQYDSNKMDYNIRIPSDVCPSKYGEPIFGGLDGTDVIEIYCRCDNTYGFTCTEGFKNPCTYNVESQFFPADPSLSKQYFIHCSWAIPYLKKCPKHLIWDQNQLTCDWQTKYQTETSYDTTYYMNTPSVVQNYKK